MENIFERFHCIQPLLYSTQLSKRPVNEFTQCIALFKGVREGRHKCRYPTKLLLLILSLILVLHVTEGECLLLRENIIIPITSRPRDRCLLFSSWISHQRSRWGMFFRIFKALVYLHMVLAACNVFPMTVLALPLAIIITPFKRNLRLYHISLMAVPPSSNLVYVAAYDTLFEMSDLPQPVRRRTFFSSLQTSNNAQCFSM